MRLLHPVQSVHRPLIAVVTVLLVLVLVPVGPGSAANQECTLHRTASMLVPVPTAGPPPFPLSGINVGFENFAGLWVYIHLAWIINVGQDKDFYLWPSGGGNLVGQQMPDFNIAFYRDMGGGQTQLVETFNDVGPVKGTVPDNADRALVWMRTGPESPFNLDGNPFGTEWNYADTCRGRAPAGSPWK